MSLLDTGASTDDLVAALARAREPLPVTLPERWHANLVIDAVDAEIRKQEGRAKRARHTGMKNSIESLIVGLKAAREALDKARKGES